VPAPRKYPDELRERALRLVEEAMNEDPQLSLNAAVHRIGQRVGIVPDTLRGWA
jgi:transposase